MNSPVLGQIIHSYFADYLSLQKGLQPASIRSYRDCIRLLLCFAADRLRKRVCRLDTDDLTLELVLDFLNHLEQARGNHVRTRNQRLAVLHSFFEYLARRIPEALATARQITAIPMKRAASPETHYLEREEMAALFRSLPKEGRQAARDRTLLLFLYNTGARAQEAAGLKWNQLHLTECPCVRLHGKGDKWRSCPLWTDTADHFRQLSETVRSEGDRAVFLSTRGTALTRFGIYKIVRRHCGVVEQNGRHIGFRITPHTFRHTAAVHLLESGVEVNVIRAWLGHVSLETTNRYAELTLRSKEDALKICEFVDETQSAHRRRVWHDDRELLNWLDSL